MTGSVVIVGCGYTGLEIARQALAQGRAVIGTTRSGETLAALAAMGAQGVRWEMGGEGTAAIRALVEEARQAQGTCDVVYSIPTLFETCELSEPLEARRHVRPVLEIYDACRGGGAAHFVYLSATSVYGDWQGAWVDEDSERRAEAGYGRMRRDIEDALVGVGGDAASGPLVRVARIAGIYGPGRTLVEALAAGRYRFVGDADKPVNRVHVADVAGAVLAMLSAGPATSRAYNVCDGSPRSARELVSWLAGRLGIGMPAEVTLDEGRELGLGANTLTRFKNAMRCRSSRLQDELGYPLRYPDVFAGYEAILGQG